MTPRVYLDWNATAPLRPEARAAMDAAMAVAGNPSSVHAEGRAARALVERARAEVAAAVGCKPAEVVFTSGATEAAGVLSGFGRVAVQDTAHDALWVHADLPVRTAVAAIAGGADAVSGAEAEASADILAWGLANSETGVIADLPVQRGVHWHAPGVRAGRLLLDITQAVGRVPFSFAWSGADMAVLSAHKLGGPKGVGALILRDGLDIAPLQRGGGQEMGRRSGTENVIGIAGFGAAAVAAMRDLESGEWARVAQLRDALETRLARAAPDTIFVGQAGPRLANTSCIAVPGWKGETQVMALDLAGFAISAGSACSSGKVRPSRVLSAMGYDDQLAASAIRVSLGPATTRTDIESFADAWLSRHEKHRLRAA